MKKPFHRFLGFLGALTVVYTLLMIPEKGPEVPEGTANQNARPFLWNRDASWDSLETNFIHARQLGCDNLQPLIEAASSQLRLRIDILGMKNVQATDQIFGEMERQVFLLGPWIGGCPDELPRYMRLVSDMRSAVKRQSLHWNLKERVVRETLYRLLYGGRMALEEVMLQMPDSQNISPVILGESEASSTPADTLLGMEIHSGDILASRGGAPTSALIARGNDFQGNFSHIALVHIDEHTRAVRIIESHIERGVAVATPEEYLRDTKLRVMVLRLRSTHPAVVADPMLPHRVATEALSRALARHIPYDFAMDAQSHDELFCSEVASEAYARHGVSLWMGLSHLTSTGLRRWLADFGVEHFETQEPSDLEYDPQLAVVADWRDVKNLQKDHLDNAVTEVMLEQADAGMPLGHNPWMLPLVRVMKGYSVMLNTVGMIGPIPEGMSARTALRHQWYVARHSVTSAKLGERVAAFKKSQGYNPPYWECLRMARQVGQADSAE